MTQEDKNLLLKDLFARSFYGVKVHCEWNLFQGNRISEDGELVCINIHAKSIHFKRNSGRITEIPFNRIDGTVLPYLRPMSSMTEEEKKEEWELWDIVTKTRNDLHYLYTDFLISHHFDYRGLIEKGLALEAPEGVYKMETQEPTERFSKQELIQRLDAIKSDIQWMYVPNKPLCEKPSQETLKKDFGFDRLDNMRHNIFKGSNMRTYGFGPDENVWTFPDGVEEKIEDDKDYKVWYNWHDASDPDNMSTYHHVYYIEEVSAGKMALLQFLKQLISEID